MESALDYSNYECWTVINNNILLKFAIQFGHLSWSTLLRFIYKSPAKDKIFFWIFHLFLISDNNFGRWSRSNLATNKLARTLFSDLHFASVYIYIISSHFIPFPNAIRLLQQCNINKTKFFVIVALKRLCLY